MKATILTVKFDYEWILSNVTSGENLVTDHVIEAMKKEYDDGIVVALKKEFHQCTVLIVSERYLSEIKVSDLLMVKSTSLKTALEDADVKIELECIKNKRLEELLDEVKHNLEPSQKKFFKEVFNIDLSAKKDNTAKENTKEKNMGKLIGFEPLEKWVEEIERIAEKFGNIIEKTSVLNNLVYLISINRGNGLSTIIDVMADTLERTNLVEFSGERRYIEWKLSYTDKADEFSSFAGLLEHLSAGRFNGIVVLDVEEWLDHLFDKRIDILLKFIWDEKDRLKFVFKIPFVEQSVLEKLYVRIDDIITVRTMKFVPPSDEQYFTYFKNFFKKYDIEVRDEVYNQFIMKVASEKNDGKFYGFNTVNKFANEILYHIIASAAKNDTNISNEVLPEHFDALYNIKTDDEISGLEQLNSMVALESVKSVVREIISTVKVQRELYRQGASSERPCFHMMFTGNPGTGKTVVARIVGRIFKEEGLLTIGNFFEVSRKDFIGKFVGHTAPKTMEVCRSAVGSVLFIDEAYLLDNKSDGFSGEAVGTLIAEMENNRDKMVVIFAGYEKEMNEFLDINRGLRDRIAYKVDFPNYNSEELRQIFYMRLNSKVKRSADFDAKVDEFFATFPENVLADRNFSNGRFVRNLVERIMSKAALRIEMTGISVEDFELTASDFSVAIADRDFQSLFGKVKRAKNAIGF